MRIRILKDCVTLFGHFQPGQVADIPDEHASEWLTTGLAMLDKSIEPQENKALQNKREKTRLRVQRYRDKKNGIVK
jgi:hypothetical protein